MLRIRFEYRDIYSKGEWKEKECIARSIEECKQLYGLGTYREYRLISVKSAW